MAIDKENALVKQLEGAKRLADYAAEAIHSPDYRTSIALTSIASSVVILAAVIVKIVIQEE